MLSPSPLSRGLLHTFSAEICPGGISERYIVLKLMLVLTTSTACFVQLLFLVICGLFFLSEFIINYSDYLNVSVSLVHTIFMVCMDFRIVTLS